MSALDSSVFPKSIPKVPELVPVFVLNLLIKDINPVFTKGQDALGIAYVPNGEIKPIKNSLGFEIEASDITGIDNIVQHLDRKVNNLDCQLSGKLPDGKGITIRYPGVIKALEPTVNVLSGKSSSSTFEESYITNTVTIDLDDDVDSKYKWVLGETLTGRGRFVRDPSNNLYVQYIVHVLR